MDYKDLGSEYCNYCRLRCCPLSVCRSTSGGNSFALSGGPETEGDSMIYIYDFGDNWRLEVVLEKILPSDTRQNRFALPGSGAAHHKT